EHDFELLEKLVCSDGRVLRCQNPGLPTLDCLLSDPARERVLLKIWNRHDRGGIVGAFNCYYDVASGSGARVNGAVSPGDIPGLEAERYCVFAHRAQQHRIMQADESWPVELAAGGFELFTVVPVQDGFAAVGLSDKFNSRAA